MHLLVMLNEAPPPLSRKMSFLIEGKVDDREWINQLIRISENELPEPQAKKKMIKE